ncbi:hypothetical protein FW774_08150 [Pedobacter sp. BS3]|uniref:hypothetical protein n=1 Tax=Pedobacter sp. BS3 TaxID=2567937 RepID=UPI0011EBC54F|nr:hypothetical protein [Pedobacter sp. BS3]TZF84930.1 hypothetical protein FW774_08150 [Pedobacter sp. BS3]
MKKLSNRPSNRLRMPATGHPAMEQMTLTTNYFPSETYPLSALTFLQQKPQVSGSVYQQNILKLLDALQCPLLLLPRINHKDAIRHIGFLTDIRFTDMNIITLLGKIAGSLNASVTVFNVTENGVAPMEPVYAEKYFGKHILPKLKNISLNLVNTGKVTIDTLRNILTRNGIDMLTAVQRRKDLLYQLLK